MRRAIAALLLVVTTACQVEATIGLLRDGEVHHESTAEALVHTHTEQAPGGHAHSGEPELRSVAGSSHDHAHLGERQRDGDEQSDHEHGSSADHCTHVHGVALTPPSADFVAIQAELAVSFRDPLQHIELVFETHSPPPRA